MTLNYFEASAQEIFLDPISSIGADRLCILSSEANSSMASWLLTTYKEQGVKGVSAELIITSVINQSITKANHEGFKDLHKTYCRDGLNTFTCSYLLDNNPGIKENFFIWLKDDIPVKAFTSSYCFTQKSLLGDEKCLVSLCDAKLAYKTFQKAVDQSIYCVNSEVEDYLFIGASHLPDAVALTPEAPNCISLPLITQKTGEPGKKSGLNWGQREKRNQNEAYIPLPSKIARSGFFPLNGQHFLVVTDDHCTLLLRVEQERDKAITTPASNAQLGEYFRKRLGLASGAYVHTKDLDAYGRQDVLFYKIDDEQYYMDFSVDTKEG